MSLDPSATAAATQVDAFAYYLPQFYPVPINSTWWGEGYTEWNALLQAQRGIRSPKGTRLTPGALGFYDLRLESTRQRQGHLARSAGLSAFCIYHYFSKGERPMGDVVDAILRDGEPDFPFFFCWANHDWTLAWQGRPEVVTWRQDYDEPGNHEHIQWLLQAFQDRRYYKIGSSPVLAIFQPEMVPSSKETFDRWRTLARAEGHSGLVILGIAQTLRPASTATVGVDCWIQSGPLLYPTVSKWQRTKHALTSPGRIWRFARYADYPVSAQQFSEFLQSSRSAAGDQVVPTVVPTWNNVGRRRRRAWYLKWDPVVFRNDLQQAIQSAPVVSSADGYRRLVALNAWNEWGEAMAIEPSVEYGDAALRLLRSVLESAPTASR